MTEQINHSDEVVRANAILDQFVIDQDLSDDVQNTKEGIELLGIIGVSPETRTVARAASLLSDAAYSTDNPRKKIESDDRIVPVITGVITSVMQAAKTKGIDVGIEIGVSLNYLEAMYSHNDGSILYPNLTVKYIDTYLSPAKGALREARKIIS